MAKDNIKTRAMRPEISKNMLVVNQAAKAEFDALIREQYQASKLFGAGITPRNKIAIIGGKGSGKSTFAEALAYEMKLPLFIFKMPLFRITEENATDIFDLIFTAVNNTDGNEQGVYLLQNLSAAITEENSKYLNWVVSEYIKTTHERSILVATFTSTTGCSTILREFDSIIYLDDHIGAGIEKVVRNILAGNLPSDFDFQALQKFGKILTYKDVVRVCYQAVRHTILGAKLSQAFVEELFSEYINTHRKSNMLPYVLNR